MVFAEPRFFFIFIEGLNLTVLLPGASEPGLTSDESRVTEVSDVQWPQLLDPVDDMPPATAITTVHAVGEKTVVQGISHDNGDIVAIRVHGRDAILTTLSPGVVQWSVELSASPDGQFNAVATDNAGNQEQTGHFLQMGGAPESTVHQALKP